MDCLLEAWDDHHRNSHKKKLDHVRRRCSVCFQLEPVYGQFDVCDCCRRWDISNPHFFCSRKCETLDYRLRLGKFHPRHVAGGVATVASHGGGIANTDQSATAGAGGVALAAADVKGCGLRSSY